MSRKDGPMSATRLRGFVPLVLAILLLVVAGLLLHVSQPIGPQAESCRQELYQGGVFPG